MTLTPLPASLSADAPRASVLPLQPTFEMIAELVHSASLASDLIFCPMRPPQALVNGELITIELPGIPALIPADTERIAGDLLANNPAALEKLQEEGGCTLSFYVPKLARFRANILMQRGSFTISLRVIPHEVPSLAALNLPAQLGQITEWRNGIVLVTGPSGSGRTSTLAALLDTLNESCAVEIVTLESPIEYLHRHKRATLVQRELFRDVPSYATGIRTSLRQPANALMLSALRGRGVVELALEAAQSGRLVLAAMNTPRAIEAVERLQAFFPAAERQQFRVRLARNLRCITSQRLLPRKDTPGRMPLLEILFGNGKTRGFLEKAETTGTVFSHAMRDGSADGMQCLEDSLAAALHAGEVSLEAAMRFAGDILEDPLNLGPVSRKPAPRPSA